MTIEYFEPGIKKGRGRAQKSKDLIQAMHDFAEAANPITGRGIGYKLFTPARLIPSMSRNSMQQVYRLLREAREEGIIPWEWIVDETRKLERRGAGWRNPKQFLQTVSHSYRRDFWDQQLLRVEVWSEKGTVRGVLQPILGQYGVGFRALHGFSSATTVYDVASDDDGRELVALYVGDYDPSGLWMSMHDLPQRLERYGGSHVEVRRIALTKRDLRSLTSFPAKDKKKDPRHSWFVKNFGNQCWELDAMDPNDLRQRVEREIKKLIEPTAWERCEIVNTAERESIKNFLDKWRAP
jgi:hypothetical protein